MKRIFLFAAGMAAFTGAVFSAEEWKLPAKEPQFKRAPGMELVVGNCVLCHSADYVSMQPPLDKTGWTAIVKKMREKYGAPLPEAQVDEVAKYLVENYGKK